MDVVADLFVWCFSRGKVDFATGSVTLCTEKGRPPKEIGSENSLEHPRLESTVIPRQVSSEQCFLFWVSCLNHGSVTWAFMTLMARLPSPSQQSTLVVRTQRTLRLNGLPFTPNFLQINSPPGFFCNFFCNFYGNSLRRGYCTKTKQEWPDFWINAGKYFL